MPRTQVNTSSLNIVRARDVGAGIKTSQHVKFAVYSSALPSANSLNVSAEARKMPKDLAEEDAVTDVP